MDAHIFSNCYPFTNLYSQRDGDSYTYSDQHADTNPNRNADGYAHCNTHIDPYAYTHTCIHSNAYANNLYCLFAQCAACLSCSDSDPNGYTNAYSDFHADSNTFSYADCHTYSHADAHIYIDAHRNCYTDVNSLCFHLWLQWRLPDSTTGM